MCNLVSRCVHTDKGIKHYCSVLTCPIPPHLLYAGLADTGHALEGESPSPTTRQLALVAYGSLAQHCGAACPQQLLSAVPALVAAMRDGKRAVRASALAAAAAAVATLGPRAVPALPKLAPAVISAASAAIDSLPEVTVQARASA